LTAAPTLERKAISLELKDGSSRAFTAIVSTPAVDRDGDSVLPSAFKAGQRVPVIVGHQWSGLPVGAGIITPTQADVRMAGSFFDTEAGKQAYETVKALGGLAEFSIGFRPIDSGFENRNGRTVRVVKDLELFEVSLVVKGAAYGTGLLDIKASSGWDGVGSFLRDVSGGLEDELSVRALSRRGFDSRDGWLQHKGVNLYPAAVLERTDERDSDGLLELRREAQVTLSETYEKAFWGWLRAAQRFGADAAAVLGPETKALVEGVDEMGGYLAPAEFRARVESYRAAVAVIRPNATVIPCGGDQLLIPMAKPHPSSPDIYPSNWVGDWFNETSAPLFTNDDPQFQTFVIGIKMFRAGLKASANLWADSEALEEFLSRSGGESLALVEDEGFISGDGLALEPLGILNSGLTPVDVEATAGGNVIGAGSSDKLIGLLAGLPSGYAARTVMVLRNATAGSIRKLRATATDNTPLHPLRIGTDRRPYLDGLAPVLYSDFVPAEGVDANQVLIAGDLASYFIADRMRLSLQVLRERFMDAHQVGVLLKSRVGGALLRKNGLAIGRV
jgi:HK97 family phage major capsid protein/HK97 family phage prohead protease